MSVAAKTKEDAASVRESISSSVDTEETCASKNLDKMILLQSEKREK